MVGVSVLMLVFSFGFIFLMLGFTTGEVWAEKGLALIIGTIVGVMFLVPVIFGLEWIIEDVQNDFGGEKNIFEENNPTEKESLSINGDTYIPLSASGLDVVEIDGKEYISTEEKSYTLLEDYTGADVITIEDAVYVKITEK